MIRRIVVEEEDDDDPLFSTNSTSNTRAGILAATDESTLSKSEGLDVVVHRSTRSKTSRPALSSSATVTPKISDILPDNRIISERKKATHLSDYKKRSKLKRNNTTKKSNSNKESEPSEGDEEDNDENDDDDVNVRPKRPLSGWRSNAFEEMRDFIVDDDDDDEYHYGREEEEEEVGRRTKGGKKLKAGGYKRRASQSEREHSDEYEDMNDFIVEDSELEIEEMRPRKKSRQRVELPIRDTEVKRQSSPAITEIVFNTRRIRSIQIDEDDDEPPVASQSQSTREILSPDIGCSLDPSPEEISGSSRASRRLQRSIIESDSEEVEENDEERYAGGDDEEEKDDEEEECSSEDGMAMYWQLDNANRAGRERMESSMAQDRQLSFADHFERYIEMMVLVHTQKEILHLWRRFPNSKEALRFKASADKVEAIFCTQRESMLSSSVWSGTFAQELLSRPFYLEHYVNGSQPSLCHSCKKSNHVCPFRICLFGNPYDAKLIWTAAVWDQHLPKGLLYHETKGDAEVGDSDDDFQDETMNPFNVQDPNVLYEHDYAPAMGGDNFTSGMELNRWWEGRINCPPALCRFRESIWSLSSNCKARTKAYHTMLHYKFRLMLKIRLKLDRCGGSAASVLADERFISDETQRFQGAMASMREGTHGAEDLWLDEARIRPKTSKLAHVSAGRGGVVDKHNSAVKADTKRLLV